MLSTKDAVGIGVRGSCAMSSGKGSKVKLNVYDLCKLADDKYRLQLFQLLWN